MYNINPTTCYIEMERQAIKRVINYLLNRSGTSRSRAVISLPVIPFVSEGDQSFTRKVALGKYPILLVVKRLENGDEHIAYSMIKFTTEQAIEWELATRAGQELKHLKEDEFFGYRVNMGMGCFMDAESALYLQAYEEFAEALKAHLGMARHSFS
ncbi:DUF4241 domain-containing protein [Bacillus safensis]|nr:DUF4241 domain-containing protein [Bacillus safensis]